MGEEMLTASAENVRVKALLDPEEIGLPELSESLAGHFKISYDFDCPSCGKRHHRDDNSVEPDEFWPAEVECQGKKIKVNGEA
jgi:hypothetical protein